MRRLVVIASLLVAACDSPSPRYAGVEAKRVVVGASEFAIRQRGAEAEAIRLSVEAAPRDGPTKVKAVAAIEQATGCAVIPYTVHGDTNVIRATLDC